MINHFKLNHIFNFFYYTTDLLCFASFSINLPILCHIQAGCISVGTYQTAKEEQWP